MSPAEADLPQRDGDFALFDADAGGALLLSGYAGELVFSSADDPCAAFAAIEAASRSEWLALCVDYEFGHRFQPRLASPPAGRVLLRAVRFTRAERLDAAGVDDLLASKLAALDEDVRVAGVAELRAGLAVSEYAQAVERIRDWIRAGDCYQINFTFPVDFTLYGDPLALYAALRRRQPVRYGGFLAHGGESVLSFSPELFFERRGTRVITRPMKGTAARGSSAAEDAACRDALLGSAKERAENVMIVDLLRNDLGRLAAPGAVRVDALCVAEAYPTLWQMVSTVSADLPDASLGDIFAALFPCGSITGAPKLRALQIIDELETSPRGLYTGAFGWLAPDGDCRFNVAIRTVHLPAEPVAQPAAAAGAPSAAVAAVPACADDVLVSENAGPGGRRARLGVGSGIVIDADPAREYAECLLKAEFLTRFDPGFELIETLLLQQPAASAPGFPESFSPDYSSHTAATPLLYPLLARHLERLQRSAHALGFACDRPAIEAALLALAADPQLAVAPVWRVRLTLAHHGRFALSHAPLMPPPATQLIAVVADERLDPDHYLLRHKTSARARYERALAALAGRPEVFDTLFLNRRGEVCEGARSNVFVERDGVLLTPPARCGLLPGVLRAELLTSGRAVESVLTLPDLLAAPRVYLGNALRGLLPVRIGR